MRGDTYRENIFGQFPDKHSHVALFIPTRYRVPKVLQFSGSFVCLFVCLTDRLCGTRLGDPWYKSGTLLYQGLAQKCLISIEWGTFVCLYRLLKVPRFIKYGILKKG